MARRLAWSMDGGAALVADLGRLKLLVRTIGGYARYQVLERPARIDVLRPVLVASGSAASIGAAMTAAERAISRFEASSPSPRT